MDNLRTALLSLPFTSEKHNKTLDLWDVTPTGRHAPDIHTGRGYCARLLHVMRDQDAPHLLFHVLQAWARKKTPSAVQTGFSMEMADAIRSAPDRHPHLQVVSNLDYTAPTIRESLLKLPFVTELADGTLNMFYVAPAGDREKAQARGRHYGALMCKFLRDTNHPSFFNHENLSSTTDYHEAEAEPVRIGLASVIAEIAMSGRGDATAHQKAARVFHEENAGGGATPAI